MLKIRSEQIEAFQPVADAQFVRRIVDHLRKRQSSAVVRLPQGPTLIFRLPDALIHRMVQAGVARARSYGLTWESSITGFVVLMFRVAPNFDQYPAINRALTDEHVAPDARIQKLLEVTTSSDWWEAKERYDPTVWPAKSMGAAG
jgi:hypothetical protein